MLICLVKVVTLNYNQVYSQILFLNFGPLNNMFGPYQQKGKIQENFERHVTCSTENKTIMQQFQNKKTCRRKL